MATRSWSALGAPFDSAGAGEGEERAPQALRSTGFLERIGARDRGDVASTLRPAERDPRSGIIAFEQLVAASEALFRRGRRFAGPRREPPGPRR